MNHRNLTARALALAALAAGTVATAGTVAVARSASHGALHASTVLRDAAGNDVGRASFVEDADGTLHVNVKVEGLAPGRHGIHIHGVGACSPDFAAAGGHHNPGGTSHGAHAGDLPNLVVNVEGRGRLNATTDRATLSAGALSVFDADGSALVIHAAEDDMVTNPAGNSGPRIACGVIGADG
jgi:Cu-Zn family superoxide dismutase